MDTTLARHSKSYECRDRHTDCSLSLRSEKGIGLPELMVSLVLFALLTAGVFVFLSGFQRALKENQDEMLLMNQARKVMSEMVWGTKAAGIVQRQGIWEADLLTLTGGGSGLQFRGRDGITRTVQTNGVHTIELLEPGLPNYKIHDPNGALADDPAENSVTLAFTLNTPRVVQIDLVLGQRVLGRWRNVSLSTQVAIRN